MERKIRIGAVSYLNSKPMLFGLENSVIKDEMDLILDYPANLVKFLKDDLIDIGLVPVAALKYFNKYNIVTDFCIATEGEVASAATYRSS